MITYAVIDNGMVVNLILWDGLAPFESDGQLIQAPEDCRIGWLFDGETWNAPPPTAEEIAEIAEVEQAEADRLAARASGVAALMALGLTEEQALAIVGGYITGII